MTEENTETRDRTRGRLAGLDALRGIASMAVVLYHYSAWYHFPSGYTQPYHARLGDNPLPEPTVLLTRGHLGVELFFIISGFVIFMTLERTDSLRVFVFSRFARLYPAFLACMIVTVVAGIVLQGMHPYPSQYVANLTMAPDLFGRSPIDGSYWSLQYELVFYALAGFCCIVMGWRKPELPCAVWMAMALMIRVAEPSPSPGLLKQLTAAHFAHLFVIGIMLFRIHAQQFNGRTLLLLIAALAIAFLGPHWTFQPIGSLEYGFTILGFTALVWFAATRRGWILATGPLRFLGRVSYPLYLVHQAAGFAVIARLEAAGYSADNAILMTVFVALLVAWVVSSLVEYPAQRWLRGRFLNGPASNEPFATTQLVIGWLAKRGLSAGRRQ